MRWRSAAALFSFIYLFDIYVSTSFPYNIYLEPYHPFRLKYVLGNIIQKTI